MAKIRPPLEWFTVWAREWPPTSPGHSYNSPDASMAAQVHATYQYRHGDAKTWKWPATLWVRDDQTDTTYQVEVQLEMRPEFTAGVARKIK